MSAEEWEHSEHLTLLNAFVFNATNECSFQRNKFKLKRRNNFEFASLLHTALHRSHWSLLCSALHQTASQLRWLKVANNGCCHYGTHRSSQGGCAAVQVGADEG